MKKLCPVKKTLLPVDVAAAGATGFSAAATQGDPIINVAKNTVMSFFI